MTNTSPLLLTDAAKQIFNLSILHTFIDMNHLLRLNWFPLIRYNVFALYIIYFYFPTFAHADDWQWAKSAGKLSYDQGRAVIFDQNSNTYLLGNYQGPSITFGDTILANNGDYDIFFVKYNNAGNVIWAKRAGKSGTDFATNVATDKKGFIYITGQFDSPKIIFGFDTLVNNSNTYTDIYLVKYDTSGNIRWARREGGTKNEYCTSIFVNTRCEMFATGSFSSSTFSIGDSTFINHTNDGLKTDAHLIKYDTSGNVSWARSSGGENDDTGNDIISDSAGNVYYCGAFKSNSITFGSNTLTTHGNVDMFLVKYTASGDVVWAQNAGGNNNDNAVALAFDPQGNIVVVGSFSSSYFIIGDTTIITNGGYDIFCAKFDTIGTLLWAQRFGGTARDDGSNLSIDKQGNIYCTGYFFSSTITFGAYTLTNTGGADNFITKLNSDGNPLYAEKIGGILDDNSYGIAIDDIGKVTITGMFNSPMIQFGNFSFTNADTLNGTSDVFVAVHSPIVGVPEIGKKKSQFSLEQNYPNPFNPQTAIGFSLLAVGKVSLKIYDVLGREVAVLLHNEQMDAGEHAIPFDGNKLSSGVYFYRLTIGNTFTQTKRMILNR